MLIVVTGTPGVGKTEFAKRLCEELGLEYFALDDVIIRNKLYAYYDSERDSYVVDVSRAREYLVENIDLTDMVIDSHLALSVIPCDDVDICFVLRCDPYLLYDRLSRKGFSEDKVLENVQAEILDIVLGEAVSLCGSEKVVQIDVSMGVGEKVDEVVEMIKRGESILSDSVDWLSKIVERGDLDRFFPPTG